jgi:hypothetical protein
VAFLSGLLGYWEPSSGVVVLSLIFGFTIGVMWLGSEVSKFSGADDDAVHGGSHPRAAGFPHD